MPQMARKIASTTKTTVSSIPSEGLSEALLDTLRKDLLEWFRISKRSMPWRDTQDPYAIWVSEVMLQQTQVATVVPYFKRFMAELPTIEALAAASEQTVLRLWSGLGYYSRVRNLHRAAKMLVRDSGGRFPHDVEAALQLPGIGEYTAGAILSIAFAQPVPAVDGNVERVLCRMACIEGPPRKAPARRIVRELAAQMASCAHPGDLNQALMELGATICSPTAPRCAACPLRGHCRARAAGRHEELPHTPPRAPTVRRYTAAGIVRRADSVLVAQRIEEGVWAGLWEFPQADVEDEDPAVSLQLHVRTTLGLEVQVGAQVLRITHGIMNQTIELRVLACEAVGDTLEPHGYTQARWVSVDELADLPLSSPHRKIARHLADARRRLPL